MQNSMRDRALMWTCLMGISSSRHQHVSKGPEYEQAHFVAPGQHANPHHPESRMRDQDSSCLVSLCELEQYGGADVSDGLVMPVRCASSARHSRRHQITGRALLLPPLNVNDSSKTTNTPKFRHEISTLIHNRIIRISSAAITNKKKRDSYSLFLPSGRL